MGTRSGTPVGNATGIGAPEAPFDCKLCPRLVGYRHRLRDQEPTWYNNPVPSFGDASARLIVVGLAPGARGANRTGRPFTGDGAGELLYPVLLETGFAEGVYGASPDDGLTLRDALITNAVRCVPPENKPTPAEITTCRPFLAARISALPHASAIIALGRIAHDSTLAAMGKRKSSYTFAHGAQHDLGNGIRMFDSYHCSRYNTSTRRLTPEMFRSVFASVRDYLGGTSAQ